MSNSNEFKRELSKIAERFSLEVIKLIQKMSVSQLAAISSGKAVARVTVETPAARPTRETPGPNAKGKGNSKTKTKTKGSAKVAATVGPKSSTVGTVKSRDRRPRSYMVGLRRKILSALSEDGGWMAASAITAIVGDSDLAFPLKELRDKALTEMDGERSKARYRISETGRAELASLTG